MCVLFFLEVLAVEMVHSPTVHPVEIVINDQLAQEVMDALPVYPLCICQPVSLSQQGFSLQTQ